MSNTRLLRLSFVFGVLGMLILGSASCSRLPESGARAWIDYPVDGKTFTVGSTVNVISHVYAPGGVAEVVLSVNGEPYRRDVPAEAGSDLVDIEQSFILEEPGMYSLQVRGFDMEGQPGYPSTISIEAYEITPTPVVTATSVPTLTPTLVPTATYVTIVTLPPAPPPAQQPDPPTKPPPPPAVANSPPPAPSPASPSGGQVLSCRSTQNLSWGAVSDPSGISGYYAKLEIQVSAGSWQSAGGFGPVSGTQVTANVQCGGIYRWMVRAQDGAGNFSSWSAPATFSVNLN